MGGLGARARPPARRRTSARVIHESRAWDQLWLDSNTNAVAPWASPTCPSVHRSTSATQLCAVVLIGTTTRTQNGHIRNDTRDVSRRTDGAPNTLISRRKCAASDRACTRVTPSNLHSKEGVDGSSPSEALQKPRKSRLFRSARVARTPVCGGYEPVMEPSGSKDRSQRLAFEREAGVSTRLRSSATPD